MERHALASRRRTLKFVLPQRVGCLPLHLWATSSFGSLLSFASHPLAPASSLPLLQNPSCAYEAERGATMSLCFTRKRTSARVC